MNLSDLQQDWAQEDNHGNLIVQLFKESRESKMDNELKKMTVYSLLFMFFNLAVNVYAWLVMVPNFEVLTIKIAGIIILLLTYAAFYMNVVQLGSIQKINHSKPIIEQQRTIEKLKIQRIKHNRFIFIFSNLFFWALITLLLKWDLEIVVPVVWHNAAIVVIVHAAFAILWFPLAVWILKKYDATVDTSNFWGKLSKDSYLTDYSINFSLNRALGYLKELEAFEKE